MRVQGGVDLGQIVVQVVGVLLPGGQFDGQGVPGFDGCGLAVLHWAVYCNVILLTTGQVYTDKYAHLDLFN